jgi:hypothetical protein
VTASQYLEWLNGQKIMQKGPIEKLSLRQAINNGHARRRPNSAADLEAGYEAMMRRESNGQRRVMRVQREPTD